MVLPSALVEAEVCFNVGRACHQLGLLHLAAEAYERALEARVGAAHAGGPLDCRREAAHNYVLLLAASGAEVRAAEVAGEFLTYE